MQRTVPGGARENLEGLLGRYPVVFVGRKTGNPKSADLRI